MKRGLSEKGIPYKLLTRVRDGELRTRSEWAAMFGVPKNRIDETLGVLRERGYPLYPIGGTFNSEGVIKEVTKHVKDFRETNTRLAKNYTNPHIIGAFRLLENYLLEDPKHHDEIELKANELVMLIMGRKQLLLQEKLKDDGN